MTDDELPPCWRAALGDQFDQPWFHELSDFVAQERQQYHVFPAADDVFTAFRLTPLPKVRVLILGQDPYHDDGQAHGLCFSVRHGTKIPPSLRNIFKELESDLGISPARHGCLTSWAKQGVLLLNTVLTVRAHQANSHQKKGWETFTDAAFGAVNTLPRAAFILWGKPAQRKANLIAPRHLILQSPHPSPLSARRGFFGSRPFSAINRFLEDHGESPINWTLPDSQPRTEGA